MLGHDEKHCLVPPDQQNPRQYGDWLRVQNWVWRDQNQLVMENVVEVARTRLMEILIPLEISLLVLLPWVVRVSPVGQSKGKIQIETQGVQRCMTSEDMTVYRVQ